MRKILLIMIGLSVGLMADFTRDAATGIVTDNKTGLQWQDNEVGSTAHWQDAIDRCEALELGGYSDWRLPNFNELISIVDISKVDPAIKDGFEHTASSYYWSSTTFERDKKNAWAVGFYYGNVSYDYKSIYYNYYVRCVRAGE